MKISQHELARANWENECGNVNVEPDHDDTSLNSRSHVIPRRMNYSTTWVSSPRTWVDK